MVQLFSSYKRCDYPKMALRNQLNQELLWVKKMRPNLFQSLSFTNEIFICVDIFWQLIFIYIDFILVWKLKTYWKALKILNKIIINFTLIFYICCNNCKLFVFTCNKKQTKVFYLSYIYFLFIYCSTYIICRYPEKQKNFENN